MAHCCILFMCGIIGLVSRTDISGDLYNGLLELQHRGQDSAGFFTYDTLKKESYLLKGIGLIQEEIKPKRILEELEGDWGIAQVRYPTIGRTSEVERRRDAQPTYASTPGFAMAHNGNIANIVEIREELIQKRRYIESECDVEIINLLLAEEVSRITDSKEITRESLFEGVRRVMQKLQGSYSVISIIRDVGFLAFRDPHAIRPLVVGVKTDGSIGFASESVALEKIGYRLFGDIKGGYVAFIPEGTLEMHLERLVEEKPAYCMFERVYFSRPSSVIDKDNVYIKRLNLGRELAFEMQEKYPDIVDRIDRIAPVPDTPRPIALNLARKLGKDFIEVFDKNRYSGRSFIKPDQKQRKATVMNKLSPIIDEIHGHSIGIVDDSIIRGNTSKVVVDILKKAGAKEVHYISGCPQNKYPCHLGIDMPTHEELIAHNMDVEEIREYIGADSLIYISIDGLKRAMAGKNRSQDYCYGCVCGEYPVPPCESYKKARIKERATS